MGGGLTLNIITANQIPGWFGSLLVCVVIVLYVSYGGLRGTAWVNTFQTIVFMILGIVTFFVIINKFGGLSNAMSLIAEKNPELLIRGEKIKPLKLLTYTGIPLSVGMFPHMFMHWLSAKRAKTFQLPLIFYPLFIAAVWIPSVLLGIIGSIDFPGLTGPAANSVLVKMVGEYAPGVLGGFLAAGIFAAIMSSLDSQVLSLGTMFTQDIVVHYGFHDKLSEKKQILFGRIFVVLILMLTFFLSLISNKSIFKLAVWSFTGFASLFPVLLAALFWKRSTKFGAFLSILSVAILWIILFIQGWTSPGYTIGGTGIMPVAVIISVGAVAMIVGSLVSKPPDESVISRFFPEKTIR
jgi:SSS family solute:Na+ symporter